LLFAALFVWVVIKAIKKKKEENRKREGEVHNG
jgi:hypothetical protein